MCCDCGSADEPEGERLLPHRAQAESLTLMKAVHEVYSRSHRNERRRRLRLVAIDRHHRSEQQGRRDG
jgi:hypothetical protein